jgi:hypothetical protein
MEKIKPTGDYQQSLLAGDIKPGDYIFVPGFPSLVYEVDEDGTLVGVAATHTADEAIRDSKDWVVYRWQSDSNII